AAILCLRAGPMSRSRRTVLCLAVGLAGCMEGQKPEPLPRASLYDRLGRAEGITRVVDDFVGNVAADPRIKPSHKHHFEHGDVAGLKKKLTDQIGAATGGPEKYTGRGMREAHKGLKI